MTRQKCRFYYAMAYLYSLFHSLLEMSSSEFNPFDTMISETALTGTLSKMGLKNAMCVMHTLTRGVNARLMESREWVKG